MANKRTYLVTGAAGYLGSEVCRQLLEQNESVRAFVLPNDPAIQYIPKDVEIVEGDLRDKASLETFFHVDADTETVVLHCASIVALGMEMPKIVMDINVGGTQNIIDLCLEHKECKTSVYKGYKRDKIEMRGDRAEMSDFPLYLNTVAGGLDRRDQTIGGFSFVVKIYAVPVVEIIG